MPYIGQSKSNLYHTPPNISDPITKRFIKQTVVLIPCGCSVSEEIFRRYMQTNKECSTCSKVKRKITSTYVDHQVRRASQETRPAAGSPPPSTPEQSLSNF